MQRSQFQDVRIQKLSTVYTPLDKDILQQYVGKGIRYIILVDETEEEEFL